MKNVYNFQTAKVQPQGLIFCQFHPGAVYKSTVYKKNYLHIQDTKKRAPD